VIASSAGLHVPQPDRQLVYWRSLRLLQVSATASFFVVASTRTAFTRLAFRASQAVGARNVASGNHPYCLFPLAAVRRPGGGSVVPYWGYGYGYGHGGVGIVGIILIVVIVLVVMRRL
jgi:hypothetical protein